MDQSSPAISASPLSDSPPVPPFSVSEALKLGREVLQIESEAIRQTSARLDHTFADAVLLLLNCPGRVVMTGVGKSGHIARKIAATLASTGTPSFFVHPAEAGHGDLGMIVQDDVVIGISNSGESDEVVSLMSFAKRFGTRTIGMSSNPASRLGKLSDIHLDSSIDKEACPLGIAPTASTAVQLAIGDALAMATLAARGFTTRDFAARHPLGALGRRYFMRVKDVMQPVSAVPHCDSQAPLLQAISEISKSRVGALIVTRQDQLAGIFTDSDMRRLITQHTDGFAKLLNEPVGNFMTRQPTTIQTEELASDALRIFDEKRISRVVCLNDKELAGLLSWHDLLHQKIA